MRTLYVLRHAKSDWHHPGLADHDRPLAPRGERAAARMAEHLRSEGIEPTVVLCSSARRARQTLAALEPVLGDADVRIESGLYGADVVALLEQLAVVDDDVDSVLLIGHNPGLHELALELAGDGDADVVEQLRAGLPTAALVTLALDRSAWSDLAPGTARLVGLVTPRSLPDV